MGYLKEIYTKRSFMAVTTLFMLFVFVISTGFALSKQSIMIPENPIEGVLEQQPQTVISSTNKNAPGYLDNETVGDFTEENDEINELDDEKEREEEKKSDDVRESISDGTEEINDIQLVDLEGDNSLGTNTFFTTTIVPNEVVTNKEYKFSIIQQKHNFEVSKVDVFVNNQLISQFKGSVLLVDGANTIEVKVSYKNKQGDLFTVSRVYTVYLDTADIIIYTNLENKEVFKPKITFDASAKKGDDEVPISVLVNGAKLDGEQGQYKAQLDEGKNIIQIIASSRGKKTEKEFIITYTDVESLFNIDTDLVNQQIKKSELSFYADATFRGQPTKLVVTCNDEIVHSNDTNYTVSLAEGENIIVLRAENSNNYIEEQYTITYLPPIGSDDGSGEKDEKAPIIKTDLIDGSRVKGSIRTFNIWPVDYQGNRIRGSSVSVLCNGKGVPWTWDDSTKTSYELHLKNGKNEVIISVTDKEGRTTTQKFYIYCDAVEDGEPIGTATISVEATTVGLGYIIPPTKVNIYQGEQASYILDRILKENGFGYEHTGTLASSFYLSHIVKNNMVTNPMIPEDLAEHVQREATRFDPEDYSTDSLGEFDFSNGSGWMYSVNGTYPNYGFSDCYLMDGDVMRIRYTLFYGMDIGGGGALGGGEASWEKEW